MRAYPAVHARRLRSGFTLIELSVVIAIIGLLFGGVIVGKKMVRAAQMRSIITDLRIFSGAIATFKEQYGYLPGDLPTATDYWGTNPTGCPPSYNGVKKKATCNGNGDGSLSTWKSPWTDFYEQFTAWQHLSNAGLITDQYVGAASSGVQNISIGNNVPKSRVPNTGWVFYPMADTWNTSPNVFPNGYTTILQLSEPYRSVSGNDIIAPLLSGPEAFSIDSKIDDGRPGFGTVSTWKDDGGLQFNCITTDVQATAEYITDVDNDLRCNQLYKYD